MRFIADLHIHSKYARAVSPRMTLPELDRWAHDKGIKVMGTGDFTHPEWFALLEQQLEPAEAGLYRLKEKYKLPTIRGSRAETRFLLTSEVANVYTRAGKGRRVHMLLFAPDLETVKKINMAIAAKGCNIKSDGRPIIGMDVQELCRIVWDINPEVAVVPAHIWTPWFAIFGSKSGFNSIEECFGKYSDRIFAMETGLSSDPAMNWRWRELDTIALISNSDSHSLERIGREANMFDTDLSYAGIMKALKKASQDSVIASTRSNPGSSNDLDRHASTLAMTESARFVATIEYFPEEGMYHYDGHRKCSVSYDPVATRKHRGICKECGKPVTVGVLNRLDKLADRSEGEVKKEIGSVEIGEVTGQQFRNRPPFVNLVTLDTIIAEALGVGTASKRVKAQYDVMLRAFGSELDILMNLPLSQLLTTHYKLPPSVSEGIRRMRAGEFKITPGFDGQYGEVHLFDAKEKKELKIGVSRAAQTLFDS